MPNQCIGSEFLICHTHLQNMAPILMQLTSENTIALPPPAKKPLISFQRKGPKGQNTLVTFDSIHEKRRFPMPCSESISSLRLTVTRAMERARSNDINAANALMSLQ